MKTFAKNALGLRVVMIKTGMDVMLILGAGSYRKMFEFKWRSKRQLKAKLAEKWERVVDVTTRRTVYFYESGTDCDGVSSGNRSKHKNIFEAEKSQDEAYNWADGPLYFSRLTKAEYDIAESHWRDHGMEAHEDGHPHSWHM